MDDGESSSKEREEESRRKEKGREGKSQKAGGPTLVPRGASRSSEPECLRSRRAGATVAETDDVMPEVRERFGRGTFLVGGGTLTRPGTACTDEAAVPMSVFEWALTRGG